MLSGWYSTVVLTTRRSYKAAKQGRERLSFQRRVNMVEEEKTGLKVKEHNRLLIIPEAYYAGGVYRIPFENKVVEFEREYVL